MLACCLSPPPSVVFLQHCQIPALIVDSVPTSDVTSALSMCAVHDVPSFAADATSCHDSGRVIVIRDHDICRVKRLSMNYQVQTVLGGVGALQGRSVKVIIIACHVDCRRISVVKRVAGCQILITADTDSHGCICHNMSVFVGDQRHLSSRAKNQLSQP